MLELHRQTRNNAAEQALGYALLAEDADRLHELSSALLDRSSDEAVAYVIQVYHKLDTKMQQILVNRCPGISGSLRTVCRHPDPQARFNTIDLVAAANHPRLAYILSLMFHDELPALRNKAADTFKVMALSLRARLHSDSPDGSAINGSVSAITLADDLNQFFHSLESLVEKFSSHLRTEVIEATMIFAPWLPDELWNKFTGEQSRIGKIATEILTRNSNLNYAGFAFRALTCPALGKNIARLIASECNPDFMNHWLRYSRYRCDFNVRKNLARIKDFRWLSGNMKPLLDISPDIQIRFVDILMLTSVPIRQKLDCLAALMVSPDYKVQEHVVSILVDSGWPEVSKHLERAVAFEKTIDFSPQAARLADRYLQRLRTSPDKNESVPAEPEAEKVKPNSDEYFDWFWQVFDQLDPTEILRTFKKLKAQKNTFRIQLAEKLNSTDPADRNRAIMLVRRCGLTESFADHIYRLCRDSDVVVRSTAVSALTDLPGKISEKHLIDALDDENLRVQANAIEVLEIFNPSDLFQIIEGKLASPNNRIRANAIKAILKPQYVLAIRALSAMLDHPDPSFRQSALWAISQTTPLHLVKKIYDLARNDTDPDVKQNAGKTMNDLLKCWKDSQVLEEIPVGAKK
jgi:hypothetical protein